MQERENTLDSKPNWSRQEQERKAETHLEDQLARQMESYGLETLEIKWISFSLVQLLVKFAGKGSIK